MEKFARFIIKLRWFIIITVTIITVFLGYQLKNIKINSDIMSSLPDSDSTAALYKKIGNEFGGNNMGMIVLETDNIFKEEVFQHIKQITDTLKITQGISSVTSLTNIIDIKSSEEGIEIGNLIDEYNLPSKQHELDSLKNYIFSKDLYKGSIVSEDATATLIVFSLLPDVDNQVIANEIKTKINAMNLPETLYFGGVPMMLNDVTNLIIADIVWLIPIVFIVISLVLFFSFRSAKGIILPLLTTGIAIIWTIGIMVLFGFEITIISNITPVILLAIGSAYTIHVLNSINNTNSGDKKQSLIKALVYIIIPVFLAAATTAVGFISFVFGSYLTMIQNFGIFTALGTIFALILSIIFIPAIISTFSIYKKNAKKPKTNNQTFLSEKILKPLIGLIFKHPKYILSTWIIVLILSIGGSFLIKISVNISEYFKKDSSTRVSEAILQNKFGGSSPIFILFEGDMQSPEVLKLMNKTEEFMKQDPHIAFTQSVAGLVKQMNDAMGEGEKIPEEQAKIEQLWFLLDGQEIMPQLVSDDLQTGIIQTRFASTKSTEIKQFIKNVNIYIEQNLNEDCKVTLTGMPSIYMKINDNLISSQFSSLILALVLVILIVGGIVRSFAKGFYAAIPIMATIFILFGFMGIAHIPLDIATVLVGSIALGIGIDYSIHIISGYNFHSKEIGDDIYKVMEKTILTSGKAIIINVISVASGFIVLILSQLVPLQNFGILIAISMFSSGIGALTLLPVILILANRKKIKKSIN